MRTSAGYWWAANPIPVRRSSDVSVGERVYAIGSPGGLEVTLSEGLVSGLRDFENVSVIQTSAAISHGSSGGGLFDSEGRLVGITTFFLKGGQNLNFALPGEWILALAEESALHFSAAASGSQLEEAKKWSEKGFSAYLDKQYQGAIDAYKGAVRLDPNNYSDWRRLGEAQQELNKDDEALKSYGESARLAKDDPLPWERMSLIYIRLQRFDEAIDAANQVVLLKSYSPTGWGLLGSAYLGAKKYKEAVDACQIRTFLDPDSSGAWAMLGVAQSGANQLSDAEASLQAAIDLAPSGAAPLYQYQLGLVYSKQGNQTKLTEIYQTLQHISPSLAEKLRRKTLVR
jgi:tetratricopeptide (TPR) repeat protein